MRLLDEFCQRHNFNGQIKEDLINTFQTFINNRIVNTYCAYNRSKMVKSAHQENINWAVCWYFNIEPDIVFNKNKRDVILIRQIAQYFGKIKSRDSDAIIGFNTGSKDHATVNHSYKKISRLIENPQTPYNKKLAEDIKQINKRL